MKKKLVISVSLCLLFTSSTGLADWSEGDPYKWVQYPNLTDFGMANHIGYEIADDWLCTQTGPVSDIHIWGNWVGEDSPDIEGITFALTIYNDGASGPGTVAWNRTMSATSMPISDPGATGSWYVPAFGESTYVHPTSNPYEDTWQANFIIDVEPFQQLGTPGNPVVYWLGVQAFIPELDAAFGWRTSVAGDQDGFAGNVDAVYRNVTGAWFDLVYPSGHQLEGSADMAFVITPEPATVALLGIGGLALIRKRRGSRKIKG